MQFVVMQCEIVILLTLNSEHRKKKAFLKPITTQKQILSSSTANGANGAQCS